MGVKLLLIKAIKGAIEAGKAIMEIYGDTAFEIHQKQDDSLLPCNGIRQQGTLFVRLLDCV